MTHRGRNIIVKNSRMNKISNIFNWFVKFCIFPVAIDEHQNFSFKIISFKMFIWNIGYNSMQLISLLGICSYYGIDAYFLLLKMLVFELNPTDSVSIVGYGFAMGMVIVLFYISFFKSIGNFLKNLSHFNYRFINIQLKFQKKLFWMKT